MKTRFLLPLTIAALSALSSASASAQSILDASGNFTVLGSTAVTNTGNTAVTGNVGVSPGLAITGFPPGTATGNLHINDGVAAQATADAEKAFEGLANIQETSNLSTNLGGQTLTPGVYKFAAAAALSGTLVLDAQGKNGVAWVIQVGSDFTAANLSAVSIINLGSNAGTDDGVFWQVDGNVTAGAGSTLLGNFLADGNIALGTAASDEGRLISLEGSVTLAASTITDNGTNGDLAGGLVFDAEGDVVAAAPVHLVVDDAKQRIWDISGSYIFHLPNLDISETIDLDRAGGYSGTATVTANTGPGEVIGDFDVNSIVLQSGTVAKVIGKIHGQEAFSVSASQIPNSTPPGVVHGAMMAALNSNLVINQNTLTLDGAISGTLNLGAGKQATLTKAYKRTFSGHSTVSVALPADMDGTWTLDLALGKDGELYSGNGQITLSNGKTFALKATGVFVPGTGVLTLVITGVRGDSDIVIEAQFNWDPVTSSVISTKSLHVFFLGQHVS